ncbi:MAG: ferritin family protein [Mycobacterium leprae]
MMMGPGGMRGPVRVHPDQLLAMLRPVVETALRSHEAGTTMPALLRETALTAFLVGAGMTPTQAHELVRQWQLAGLGRGESTGPMRRSDVYEPGRPAETGMTTGMEHRGMELFHPSYDAQFKPQQQPRSGREGLLQSIRSAMQDETSAAAFYTELMNLTKNEDVRAYIQHARDDERKHYRMLGELYRELTGQSYEAQPQPTTVLTLQDGLKMAMDREYEAAEEYRRVYLEYPQERVRRVFFELMTDEMEHVTRFNYALDVERSIGER